MASRPLREPARAHSVTAPAGVALTTVLADLKFGIRGNDYVHSIAHILCSSGLLTSYVRLRSPPAEPAAANCPPDGANL